MEYVNNTVNGIKIAYIGGGSRGWAWGLMSDLAACDDINGDVYLYDIDLEAAKNNEIIGNKFNNAEGAKSVWNYHATETIEEALTGANFIVISILPGTFDEMNSDVHTPEKYGIYQSVGDTSGPGGIVRAMRTIPMYEYIAEKIKECCPDAWVINYTNPMTLCVKTLYRVFPEIKAFGCCHEVFGTQKFLARMIEETFGEKDVYRGDIKVNPLGINHFTWVTKATWKNVDLYPYYDEFVKKYADGYQTYAGVDGNWMNSSFRSDEKVKMDLYLKTGVIAAAGDRHLAEFCEGKWYLASPERVREMHFGLTTVDWRRKNLVERLDKSARLLSGEEEVKIKGTGEEGVNQIRALLGLIDLVTNVNIPNQGQIPNLPLGAVVETNAVFRANSLEPVCAGPIPQAIYPMISRICGEQEMVSEGIAERDLDKIFIAFANDPLVTCGLEDAKKLFKEMVLNTKEYLTMFDLSKLED
ncbi:MAG: alpha-glucosidase/alpha-galactosidase [Lachnospiraceae bacterium]|nr:alpha-glucosidase/alpha-galactosidase [Lachnospiraceae bacterium]